LFSSQNSFVRCVAQQNTGLCFAEREENNLLSNWTRKKRKKKTDFVTFLRAPFSFSSRLSSRTSTDEDCTTNLLNININISN
jgi:hypothetical protein